jgi:hypothetical protein
MIDLPTVTLLIYNPDKSPDLSARALLHTLSIIKPARTIHLCTNRPLVTGQWENVLIQNSPWQEGQRFQDTELIKYFDTPHLMHIETDGFPINPQNWDTDFLNYDYIGAPWGTKQDGYAHTTNDKYRIGNGGFSIQSKRFREFLYKIRYEYKTGMPSDVWFCQTPQILDRIRPKFPDLKTAIRFSFEGWIPEYKDWQTANSFGIHGLNAHKNIIEQKLNSVI